MDVEPRNAETSTFPGRALDRDPFLGPMLAQAMAEGKPVASDPFPLLRHDGPVGLVLAAPVLPEGGGAPAGFVTFSYELAPLMLTNDDLSLFSVALKDPRDADRELVADQQGIVTSRATAPQGRAPSMLRTVTFGSRDWALGYYAKANAAKHARADRHRGGGDRPGADQHRLRAVRLCRLQQSAAQPRDRSQDRLRAAADGGDRRTQSPGQEHPRGDPVDRDPHAAPRLRHRRRPRAPDRPHPCDVERGLAAQRKPVAGRRS